MNVRRPPAAVALCSLLLLAGCGGGGGSSPAEPPPAADSLTIVSVEPSESTALPRGGNVSFRVRTRYEMAQATTGGIVATAIGFSSTSPIFIFTNPLVPEARISGHRGETELVFSLTVPQSATQVLIDLTLFPGNASTSNVGDELIYSTR